MFRDGYDYREYGLVLNCVLYPEVFFHIDGYYEEKRYLDWLLSRSLT